ncbi:MAG: phosphotransferase [Phycisphaerae bacterium]
MQLGTRQVSREEPRSTSTTQQRASFDEHELAHVLGCYDIGVVEYDQEFARGTYESAKRLITTDRGRFLLKRRARGRTSTESVTFAHKIQNFLVEKSYPTPHLIGTRGENRSMLRRGDDLYEMYEFVPGERYAPTPDATDESGRMLAVLHRLVREAPDVYQPAASHYHDSARVRTLLPKLSNQLPDAPGAPSARGRAGEVAQIVTRVGLAYEAACRAVRSLGLESWPSQIIHGDWHPGNLLYHDRKIVAVIDFDAARSLPPVVDVANGALQFSMLPGGRDVDAWPDHMDAERLTAFLAGYDAMNRLSLDELRCISPLMIEALVSETVGPIAAHGHFATLDGFVFLRKMLRRVRWLEAHAARLIQDRMRLPQA